MLIRKYSLEYNMVNIPGNAVAQKLAGKAYNSLGDTHYFIGRSIALLDDYILIKIYIA